MEGRQELGHKSDQAAKQQDVKREIKELAKHMKNLQSSSLL